MDFDNPGIKTIKAKIVYTDSSVYESHFNIYTEADGSQSRYAGVPDIETFITAARVHSGSAASANVHVYISQLNNGQIRKPLIVAEGFDASHILGTLNFSSRDFLLDMDRLINQNYDLQDELDLAEYDIVFIDYTNGTDYIQNNAYLFQDVVKWVNQQKTQNGSTEQNVVLGLSMGGLVARWGLKDIEDRSETHDVRLNISMDSPHDGSYVPLAAQALVRGTYDFKISLGLLGIPLFSLFELSSYTKPAHDVLNSPAAKQMLIYQVAHDDGDFEDDNSTQSDFISSYHSKGLPAQCTNMGISNGSSCGDLQGISPGDYMSI